MNGLQQQLDHAGVALSRFAEQFKGKDRLAALLAVFTNQVQTLENTFWALYTERWISTAVGAQLDVLGRIVGQLRDDSANDAEYRVRIQARILCNRSSGTGKDIYGIFKVLLPTVNVLLLPGYPAGFEFFVNTPITAAYAAFYSGFVFAAKVAGVGANFIWYPTDDAHSFFTESTVTFVRAISTGGSTFLYVQSVAGFPGSGTLMVDQGTAGQETVTYSGVISIGGPRFVCSPVLAHTHLVNAAVALVGTVGLGWSDTNNPTTGGEMAGAIGG